MQNKNNIVKKDTQWIQYNKKNQRDQTMAQLWIRPLLSWFNHPSDTRLPPLKNARLLDFGCGYLDVGIGLRSHCKTVDGYDIDPLAREIAARRLQQLHVPGFVYSTPSQIPQRSYDFIVVNSVFQYLSDLDDLKHHVGLLVSWLNAKGVVLICDLIPSDYSSVKDAFHSLTHACLNGCLAPMLKHLWYAATKSSRLKLLTIDRPTIKGIALDLGYQCSILPKNLSPSPYRYSVLLHKGEESSQPLT